MRFLADAQLPPLLAVWLNRQGYDAKAVRDVCLREASDKDIWAYAQHGDWIVISKDEDLVEFVLSTTSGPPVVWLRIGNCTNPTLLSWLSPLWPQVIESLSEGHRIIEVRQPQRGD